MPDNDLLALLDQVDAAPSAAPTDDRDILAMLDAVEAAPVTRPQYKPVGMGALQSFKTGLDSVGQSVLSGPALLEAGIRRFVGPTPSPDDVTPLGAYLRLGQQQQEAQDAAASYDQRSNAADKWTQASGLGQEVLDAAAGSIPAMVAPMAAGMAAKVPQLANSVAQAAQRLRVGSRMAGLTTATQSVQDDPSAKGQVNAVAQGVLEAAFMRLGGTTGVEALFRATGADGAMQGVRAALKAMFHEAGHEMPEEALTGMSQDAVDQVINTGQFDPQQNLRAGIVSAGAGAAMGAGANAGPAVSATARAAGRTVADAASNLSSGGMGQANTEIAAAGNQLARNDLEAAMDGVPDNAQPGAFIGNRRQGLRDPAEQPLPVRNQALQTSALPTPPTADGLDPAADDAPLPQVDPLLSMYPTDVGNLARLDRSVPDTEIQPDQATAILRAVGEDVAPDQLTTTRADVGIRQPDVRPSFRSTTTGMDVPIRQEASRAQAAPPAERPAGPVPGAAPAAVGEAAPHQAPVAPQPKGWKRFAPETGTLNIPRAQMPQIDGDKRGALSNFLRARDISWNMEEVDPSTLKPTQAEWHPKKVAKAQKSLANTGDQARAILVSSDGHVIDGHHQAMAAQDAGQPIKVIRIGAPIREALAAISEFPSARQDAGATSPSTPSPRKETPHGPQQAGGPATGKQSFQPGQRVRVTKGKRAGLEATISGMVGDRPVLRTDDGKTLGETTGIVPSNLEPVADASAAPVETPASPAAPRPVAPAKAEGAKAAPPVVPQSPVNKPAPAAEKRPNPAVAKLRQHAAAMSGKAEADLSRDRLSNTRKRAEQAASAIRDASQRQADATTAKNLADALERGEVEHLTGAQSMADVVTLRRRLDNAVYQTRSTSPDRNRWTDNHSRVDTSNPTDDEIKKGVKSDDITVSMPGTWVREALEDAKGERGAPALRREIGSYIGERYQAVTTAQIDALRTLAGMSKRWGDNIKGIMETPLRLRRMGITNGDQLRDALVELNRLRAGSQGESKAAKLEREIRFQKIPGFFPTPPALADEAVRKADIQPGMRVLEPEGGKGDLAQRAEAAGGKVDVAETQSSLREILESKGFNLVGRDMLEIQPPAEGPVYDRVVMNPPFENGQDREHVRHAYDLLKPGGRLVAIMSPGPFQRSFKADQEFKAWAESVGAVIEDNEAGAFAGKEAFRQTGVHTVTVTIDKPVAASQPEANPVVSDEPPSSTTQPEESTAADPYADLLADPLAADIPLAAAMRGHSGTSMVPEQRARGEVADYVRHLRDVRDRLSSIAKTPEQQTVAEAEFARYRAGYRMRRLDALSKRGRVMSAMVAGPANFPGARNKKRSDSYEKSVTESVDWSERAQKAAIKAVRAAAPGGDPTAPVSSDDADAVTKLKGKIDNAERLQAAMIAGNKVVRDKKLTDDQKVAKLIELGLTENRAREALKPDFAGNLGFPTYALTNNNANIRRMNERVEELEQKRGQESRSVTVGDITVSDDVDGNRLRLTFPGKPEPGRLRNLKAAGFKWSPKEMSWQRMRGDSAIAAAETALGIDLAGLREAPAPNTMSALPGQSFAPERPLDSGEPTRFRAAGMPPIATSQDVEALDPIVLTGSELNAADNYEALRDAAKRHLASLRGAGPFVNEQTGRDVIVDRQGAKEPLYGFRTVDDLRGLAALPASIEQSIYTGTENDEDGKPVLFHYFQVPAMLAGQPRTLTLVIRETDGLRFYDQHYFDKRANPVGVPGRSSSATSPEVADPRSNTGSEESIPNDAGPGKQPAPTRPARGRIPVAPIAPVEAKDAERVTGSIGEAITTLRDEFRKHGVGDPQLAAGETPKGAAGMFDEAIGISTLYRSNDLDAASHELGHQVAWKFGFDAEDIPGETDFFAKSGSQAPPNLIGKDLRDYRAKEAWAEFIRAWTVNPDATEAQAPRMTELFKREVPATVQKALADFGRFGREFLGLPAAARTQANIEQTEALIEAGSTVRAMSSMFGLGEAMQAARGERGAWLKLRAFMAKVWKGGRVPLAPPGMKGGASLNKDEIAAYRSAIKSDNGKWAAFRWQWQNVWFPAYQRFSQAYEIRGREVKPEHDFRILNRLLSGTDGKVLEAVFGSGLRDSRNRAAVDAATGESLTLSWLLDPISKSVDRDTGEVAAVTPGAFTKLVNKALAYGVELRTFGRGIKLIEKASKDAQRFVEDLDAFIGGTADMGVMESVEKRWRDAGLDLAMGSKMRVMADRLTKMAGERAGAPDARNLRKFTEMYGERVREIAAEKAARLSGIGAGLTSDFNQAQKAIKEREADPDKPAMDEFLRRYRRWAQHLVQYLEETGVYSEEQAKSMLESDTWKNPETGETLDFYLDMHRIFERDGSNIMPGRRFTGSTKTVRNPMANLLEATLNAIANGDRNRAMASLADAFRNRKPNGDIMDDVRDARLGEWGRQVPEETVQEARRSGQTAINGRIPYLIKNNGVREFWTFDPWVEASIEAARRQGSDGNLLLRMWATATRVMRTGITTFPSFMLRNLARDVQSRFVVGETGKALGLADIFRGYGGITSQGKTESVDTMRKVAGASYAGYNDGRVQIGQALAQHLDSLIHPSAGAKVARAMSPVAFLRLTERLNEWFEAVNRNAELSSAYNKAKGELGYDDFNAQLYAADKSRGLIDFAEAGVYSRQLNRAVLFVNPAIQGLARFARTWNLVAERAAKGKNIPEKVLLALTARATISMALMTAASIAARMMLSDEDEEKWEQQSPTVRDFHWIIPMRGAPDIAIPRPYDFGFILAGAERLTDAIMAHKRGDKEQVRRAFEGYAKSAAGALLPINDVSSLMGGFSPLIEAGFNYDTFRQRHIIPTWEEGTDLRLRDTDRASSLGKMLQRITGEDARLMDHIIEGYAGNWGRAATSVGKPADWWLGTLTGMFKTDPAGAARDVQWVYDEASRLRVGGNSAVREMTRLLREARQAVTVLKREDAAEKARKYAAKLRNAWEKNPPKVLPAK